MPEIGIVEAKSIIRVIKQKFNYDFSQYSLTAFRFGLDRTIFRHHLRYSELLTNRILEDEEFFDELLFDINDVIVEFFRDPEMWIMLKSAILPHLFEKEAKPKIWIPGVCNNQEIFSLLLLLRIEFPEKDIEIYVSTFSAKTGGIISRGELSGKQLESGQENFEKVFPQQSLITFIKPKENDYMIESPFLEAVKISQQNLLFEPVPESPDLILFRNGLLNYTIEHQKTVLDTLVSCLAKDGYLITGIKENIDEYINKQKNLKLVNRNEKVYIKINKF
jgi:chemotaxis protein methyltransferase CheR